MLYNDVGVGYFLVKSTDPQAWLTAIAPTFEVHVNTPLTHGDWTNRNDPGGTPNVVNLTYGLNCEFNHRSILTLGLVTPVTGPRPFDYEALILYNVFFGRTGRDDAAQPTRSRRLSVRCHYHILPDPPSRLRQPSAIPTTPLMAKTGGLCRGNVPIIRGLTCRRSVLGYDNEKPFLIRDQDKHPASAIDEQEKAEGVDIRGAGAEPITVPG